MIGILEHKRSKFSCQKCRNQSRANWLIVPAETGVGVTGSWCVDTFIGDNDVTDVKAARQARSGLSSHSTLISL